MLARLAKRTGLRPDDVAACADAGLLRKLAGVVQDHLGPATVQPNGAGHTYLPSDKIFGGAELGAVLTEDHGSERFVRVGPTHVQEGRLSTRARRKMAR